MSLSDPRYIVRVMVDSAFWLFALFLPYHGFLVLTLFGEYLLCFAPLSVSSAFLVSPLIYFCELFALFCDQQPSSPKM